MAYRLEASVFGRMLPNAPKTPYDFPRAPEGKMTSEDRPFRAPCTRAMSVEVISSCTESGLER